MDHKTFGKWLTAPIKYAVLPFTMLFVAMGLFLWLGGYMLETTTGKQILPPVMAPPRLTDDQKIKVDQANCAADNVLVDMKAAESKSKDVEDKILKTLLNHHYVYGKNLCNVLYDMDSLIPPGTVRRGVPRRNDLWIAAEFIFEGKRKTALVVRFRQLEEAGFGHNLMPEWEATHYFRPNRPRTKGNQTKEEIESLKKTHILVPKSEIVLPDGKRGPDPEGGFQFLAPKVNPKR